MSHSDIPPADDSAPPDRPQALLILSLGSVQVFLREARRTQDLWMGSFLLSYLAYTALAPILALTGGEAMVVMPDMHDQPLHRILHKRERVPIDEVLVANVPTIFTALVPGDQVDQLTSRSRASVDTALRDMAGEVFDALATIPELLLNRARDRARWQEQMAALAGQLGLFWGACDRTDDPARLSALAVWLGTSPGATDAAAPTPYETCARAAGRAHASRKMLRDFATLPADSSISTDKCTQCRTRPQVLAFGGDDDAPGRPVVLPRTLTWHRGRKVKLQGRLRRGDRLCAVCLTKRFAWEHYFRPKFGDKLTTAHGTPLGPDDHLLFPSTSSIATAPFKRDVLEHWSQLTEPVRAFMNAVGDMMKNQERRDDLLLPSAHIPALRATRDRLFDTTHTDWDATEDWLRLEGAWLFEDAFDAEQILYTFGLQLGDIDIAAVGKAGKALQKLVKQAASLRVPVPSPSPYLCLLTADGDHMGKWVGEHPGLDECYQRKIASALRKFATGDASRVIQTEGLGTLLYAGGDDVLALLPVRDAAQVAGKIRDAYTTSVDQTVFPARAADEPAMTLSASLVVMHRTESLSQAVIEGHDSLTHVAKAEKVMNRDALVVRVLRRSAGSTDTGGKWSTNGVGLTGVLTKLVDLFGGVLSPSLMNDLNAVAPGFGRWTPPGSSATENTALAKAGGAELRRLAKRHAAKNPDGAAAVVESLVTVVGATPGAGSAWQRVSDALTVARFLAREA